MKCHRAQIFSYDLVFAMMALTFLIWYSISATNAFAEKIGSVEGDARMAEVAQSALTQLTESPGDPSDWGSFDASSIGLIESRGALDDGKVSRFSSLAGSTDGYEKAKAILSFNRQGGAYFFNFKVSETGGGEIYSAGPKEPSGASVALASKTMAMNGRLVRVSVRAWDVTEGTG